MDNSSNIDFVILWVNGDDPAWLKDFESSTRGLTGDARKCRFRDWDNLRYIFRGFEIFTPWVRKIHFVTCGHLPSWLNVSHEKLRIVNHSDFLDEKNLPVFSSHPIEVNLHRIEGLSEKFVYFNDDTFLLKKVPQESFFRKELPCDMLTFNAISDSDIANIKINDVQCIHRHFKKYEVVKRNFFKIFNCKTNFIELLKTLLLMPWPKMTGFYDPHLPQPFLKRTFYEVWEKENSILSKTSASKVRSCADVNQYLFRYWRLCQGEFAPVGFKNHHFEWIRNREDAVVFIREILSGKYDMVCINDGIVDEVDFSEIKDVVNQAFEVILPKKSTFEV